MNGKKLWILGVLALVVFVSIFAAGCTSSSNSATSSNSILGSWGNLNTYLGDGSVTITTFMAGGVGKEYCVYQSGEEEMYYFNWKENGNNTYHLTYWNGEEWDVTVVGTDKQLEWKQTNKGTDKHLEWKTTRTEDGKEVSYETTLFTDFNGKSVATYPDGKIQSQTFNWVKTNPDVYLLTYENGDRWEVTLSKTDNLTTWKKIDYSGEPIIGTHSRIDNGKTYTTTFNVNGTGKEVETDSTGTSVEYNFVWSKTDTNTYNILYWSDTVNVNWTIAYNPADKSFTWKQGNMQWVDNYVDNMKHETEILNYSNLKGKAIEFDSDGNATEFQTTWKKTGENTYMVSYNDSEVWIATYHPDTHIFTWKRVTNDDYGND